MSVADTLVRLQEIDLELLKHASTLSAMPQRKRLQTIELAARKVATELKGIVGQRKDAETEIADVEEALAHYREKTVEVQAAADAGEHTHREIRDFEQQQDRRSEPKPRGERENSETRRQLLPDVIREQSFRASGRAGQVDDPLCRSGIDRTKLRRIDKGDRGERFGPFPLPADRRKIDRITFERDVRFEPVGRDPDKRILSRNGRPALP